MTSPTKPLNIVSPRSQQAPGFGTPSSRRGVGSRPSTPGSGTPDLRSLRAQYIGTPPPLPNIPPRTGTSTPRPSTSTEPIVLPGRSAGPRHVPSISSITARRPGAPVGLGLDDYPPPDPTITIDVENPYEDERVKVLRKHLVSREEREGNNGSSGFPSRQASSSNLSHHFQQDAAFPVPYHTPGGDITYVRRGRSICVAQLFPF